LAWWLITHGDGILVNGHPSYLAGSDNFINVPNATTTISHRHLHVCLRNK